jgi:hypothetical protein
MRVIRIAIMREISEKHAKLARLNVSEGTCPFGLTVAETKKLRRTSHPPDGFYTPVIPGGVTLRPGAYSRAGLLVRNYIIIISP